MHGFTNVYQGFLYRLDLMCDGESVYFLETDTAKELLN